MWWLEFSILLVGLAGGMILGVLLSDGEHPESRTTWPDDGEFPFD